MFSRFTSLVTKYLGHPSAFGAALSFLIFWFILGAFFKFNDNCQLIFNLVTTIIPFLMVFILQNAQNKAYAALQLKLDEIILSNKRASNDLIKIEELSDKEIEILQKRYEAIAPTLKKNGEKNAYSSSTSGNFSLRI